MTTKIPADRIRQIIREEAARANTRWYMNESSPLDEAFNPQDGDEARSVQAAIIEKYKDKEDWVAKDKLGCKSADRCPDGDFGPSSKRAFKDLVGKNISEFADAAAAIAAIKAATIPGAEPAAAEEPAETPAPAPEAEPVTKRDQLDQIGAIRGEKFLSRDGTPLKEKEFGWYKMDSVVTLNDRSAEWLKDAKNGKSYDGKGKKRKYDDIVTHVRIVFNKPQILSIDNILDKGKVKYIMFKLARAGAARRAPDYRGGHTDDAALLAVEMLKGLGFEEQEGPAQADESLNESANHLWQRIIG